MTTTPRRRRVGLSAWLVAAFVTVNTVSSEIVVFVGVNTNTGATFTSVTITSKLFVRLNNPSLTTVVNV